MIISLILVTFFFLIAQNTSLTSLQIFAPGRNSELSIHCFCVMGMNKIPSNAVRIVQCRYCYLEKIIRDNFFCPVYLKFSLRCFSTLWSVDRHFWLNGRWWIKFQRVCKRDGYSGILHRLTFTNVWVDVGWVTLVTIVLFLLSLCALIILTLVVLFQVVQLVVLPVCIAEVQLYSTPCIWFLPG